MRVPTRQCGVSSPQKGHHLKDRHGGVQNLAGDPRLQALLSRLGVSVLETRRASRSLKMAHSGNLRSGVDSAGPPRGAVQPFPVGYPGVTRNLQVQGGLTGSAQARGGPLCDSLPSITESQDLNFRKGQMCVCANMGVRRCQCLERVWVQMGLFCAYLIQVAE